MKVIIQIPCFNEEKTLPDVFQTMPRSIVGVDILEYQIVDDGSTDNTIKVAKELGVHHIVEVGHKNRRWLGRAFAIGVDHALAQGADILVNTDGDNQYPSEAIPALLGPLLKGEADIVIGDRGPSTVAEFSLVKRFLQGFGSKVVGFFSGTDVPDAVSGFRAYNFKALRKINITTNYTYTIDTLMQANIKGLDVAWIPIRINRKTRDSRLIRSLSGKVLRSASTILRISAVYQPLKTASALSILFFGPALYYISRFLYFYSVGEGQGNIQSLVLSAALLVMGGTLVLTGILGELFAVNRRLLESILEEMKINKQNLSNEKAEIAVDIKRTSLPEG